MLDILLGKRSGALPAAEVSEQAAVEVPHVGGGRLPTKRQVARAQRQEEMRQRLDTMRQERAEQQQDSSQAAELQQRVADQRRQQAAAAAGEPEQQAGSAPAQAGVAVQAEPPLSPGVLGRAGGVIR